MRKKASIFILLFLTAALLVFSAEKIKVKDLPYKYREFP